MNGDIEIREEAPADEEEVRRINIEAFEQPDEADLVEQLRNLGAIVLSLVAVRGRDVIGHIVFSEVSFESAAATVRGVGLGPVAVRPDIQKEGVGSRLVREGLDRCRHLGYELAVVLGHPGYYPRFGFIQAEELGLRCEWDVPPGVFMALVLVPGVAGRVRGLVRYHPAFGGT